MPPEPDALAGIGANVNRIPLRPSCITALIRQACADGLALILHPD